MLAKHRDSLHNSTVLAAVSGARGKNSARLSVVRARAVRVSPTRASNRSQCLVGLVCDNPRSWAGDTAYSYRLEANLTGVYGFCLVLNQHRDCIKYRAMISKSAVLLGALRDSPQPSGQPQEVSGIKRRAIWVLYLCDALAKT
ncbi:hypothetical protein RRG08_009792 [Elysia crispata]|uniref:Uncharacterized protein n=1 Tax=Elysia crispata TaxID=231223 RepID=A0AAE0ZR01_9GAST|nr:hypothetical protein RRG08_009792 [Elysia crispata]